MNETTCNEIERIVWTEGPDAAPQDHLAECASCREEARRAGDITAALSGMQLRFAAPPEGLEAALLATVNRTRRDRAREVVTHPKFLRGAAVGAAAAATAVAGILIARRASRTERPGAERELVA